MSTPYSASGAVPSSNGQGQDDTGPRIAKIETFCTPLVGFVRVTSEDGQQGWGQVSTYNSDLTCESSTDRSPLGRSAGGWMRWSR